MLNASVIISPSPNKRCCLLLYLDRMGYGGIIVKGGIDMKMEHQLQLK